MNNLGDWGAGKGGNLVKVLSVTNRLTLYYFNGKQIQDHWVYFGDTNTGNEANTSHS